MFALVVDEMGVASAKVKVHHVYMSERGIALCIGPICVYRPVSHCTLHSDGVQYMYLYECPISIQAQGLRAPITSFQKLQSSSHVLYLLTDKNGTRLLPWVVASAVACTSWALLIIYTLE